MGEERARELVAELKWIAGPVVQAAEADLRQSIYPDAPVVWSMDHRGYIANVIFKHEVESLCVGVLYEDHAGDAEQNSIELRRDAVLRWRRCWSLHHRRSHALRCWLIPRHNR